MRPACGAHGQRQQGCRTRRVGRGSVSGIVEGGVVGLACSRRSSSDRMCPIVKIPPDRRHSTREGALPPIRWADSSRLGARPHRQQASSRSWSPLPPPINVARNSHAISSNVEFTSLELQRFRVISKSDRGKLRATFVWRLSGHCPRVAWLGPCLEARPCSPTLRPLRLGVSRAGDGGFASLEASLRRVAGVSRLYWCNSPRLVAVRSRFGAVWRPRARRGTQVASTPRRTTPLTLSIHTRPCVRPHIRHVGAFTPHDETSTSNTDCSAPASRKVTTKTTRFVL